MSCEFYIDKHSLDKDAFARHARSFFSTEYFSLVRGDVDGEEFLVGGTPSFSIEENGWYLISGGSRGVLISDEEEALKISLTVLTTYIEWMFMTELLRCGILAGGYCRTQEDQPIMYDHLRGGFTRGWFTKYWEHGKKSMNKIIKKAGSAECPCYCYSLVVDKALMSKDDEAIEKALVNEAYKYATAHHVKTVTDKDKQKSEYSYVPTIYRKGVQEVTVQGLDGSSPVPLKQFLKIAEKYGKVGRFAETYFADVIPEKKRADFEKEIEEFMLSSH